MWKNRSWLMVVEFDFDIIRHLLRSSVRRWARPIDVGMRGITVWRTHIGLRPGTFSAFPPGIAEM
jgi:hypothetical protein